jgi:hypothetical protein
MFPNLALAHDWQEKSFAQNPIVRRKRRVLVSSQISKPIAQHDYKIRNLRRKKQLIFHSNSCDKITLFLTKLKDV